MKTRHLITLLLLSTILLIQNTQTLPVSSRFQTRANNPADQLTQTDSNAAPPPTSQNITGRLVIVYPVGHAARYYLIDSLGTVELIVTPNAGNLYRYKGATITATGNLTIQNSQRILYVEKWLLVPSAAPQFQAVSGSQSTLMILIQFSDISGSHSVSYFQNMLTGPTDSMNAYYVEVSFNSITVTGGTTSQWYTLAHPSSYYNVHTWDSCNSGGDFNKLTQDIITLVDPYVNFAAYAHFIIVTADSYVWGCMLGGTFNTNDGPIYGVAYVQENYGLSTFCHEFGHELGLPDLYDYNSPPDPYSFIDGWDEMGYDNAQHFTSWSKIYLGWIPTSKIATYTGSSITQTISRIEYSTNGYHALKIQTSSSIYYLVETRQKVGFDVNLPSNAPDHGVLITKIDESKGSGHGIVRLVDANPTTQSPSDGDAVWQVGQTYTDTTYGFSVSVQSWTGTGFIITVAPVATVTEIVYSTSYSLIGSDPSIVADLHGSIYNDYQKQASVTTYSFHVPINTQVIFSPSKDPTDWDFASWWDDYGQSGQHQGALLTINVGTSNHQVAAFFNYNPNAITTFFTNPAAGGTIQLQSPSGTTNVGGTDNTYAESNDILSAQFSVSAPLIVSQLGVYVNSFSSGAAVTLGLYNDNGAGQLALPTTLIAQTTEVQITASNTWLYSSLQTPAILQANIPYWVAIETNGVNKGLYWAEKPNGVYPGEPACGGISYSTTLPNTYPSCPGSLTSAYFYESVVAGSLSFTNGQPFSVPIGNYPVTGNSALGYVFSSWSSSGSVSVSSSSSNPTTMVVSSGIGSLTAFFNPIPCNDPTAGDGRYNVQWCDYTGSNVGDPIVTNTWSGPNVVFSWGSGNVDNTGRNHDVYAFVEGSFSFSSSGPWTLTTQHDDGLRVFIDGGEVYDNWNWISGSDSTTVSISAGIHEISIQYYAAGPPNLLALTFTPPVTVTQTTTTTSTSITSTQTSTTSTSRTTTRTTTTSTSTRVAGVTCVSTTATTLTSITPLVAATITTSTMSTVTTTTSTTGTSATTTALTSTSTSVTVTTTTVTSCVRNVTSTSTTRTTSTRMVPLTSGVDSGSGSISPDCSVGCSEAVGSFITVTATADSGWRFSGWSTQTGVSCSANPCSFTMPNSQVTLKATFIQIVPVSSLGSVLLNAPSGTVYFIFPDSNTAHAKPTKLLGVGYAQVTDWTALGYVYGSLANMPQVTALDTNTTYVDPSTGAPLIKNSVIVLFGGRLVNTLVAYYDQQGISPLYWKLVGGFGPSGVETYYTRSNVVAESMTVGTITAGSQDMPLIQVFADPFGNTVIIFSGFGWKGTFGAGLYFKTILSNPTVLATLTDSWYFYSWKDLNGNGFADWYEVNPVPTNHGN